MVALSIVKHGGGGGAKLRVQSIDTSGPLVLDIIDDGKNSSIYTSRLATYPHCESQPPSSLSLFKPACSPQAHFFAWTKFFDTKKGRGHFFCLDDYSKTAHWQTSHAAEKVILCISVCFKKRQQEKRVKLEAMMVQIHTCTRKNAS